MRILTDATIRHKATEASTLDKITFYRSNHYKKFTALHATGPTKPFK